jgi:hypothetical protein
VFLVGAEADSNECFHFLKLRMMLTINNLKIIDNDFEWKGIRQFLMHNYLPSSGISVIT